MKRHVGKLVNTDQKVVVAMMQIPGRGDHALVIPTDSLPPRYEQAVRDLLESAEGQAETDFSKLLGRRIMSDTGRSVLETLHTEGRLMAVPVSSVLMLPMPNQPFPLVDIISMMAPPVAGPPPVPQAMPQPPVSQPEEHTKFNPHSTNLEAGKTSDQEAVARNLLFEAQMIEGDAKALLKDAEAKRHKAFAMAPSLRPAAVHPPTPVPSEPPPGPLLSEVEQVVLQASPKVTSTPNKGSKVTLPPRRRTQRTA